MKSILIYGLALVFLPLSAAKSDDISSSSPLEVHITLYPQEVALIKEKRKAHLPEGTSQLALKNISPLILMDTFLFQVLSPSPFLDVLEYTFRSSHITREELLKRSLGEPVVLLNPETSSFSKGGRLLALDGPTAIVDSGGVILGAPKNQIGFTQLPHTLVPEPVITLKVMAAKEGESLFEMGYLTKGFAWKASYTIIVDPSTEHLDLHNWISLTNKSGVHIKNGHFRIAHTQTSQERFYAIEHPVTLTDQGRKNISWFSAKELVPLKNFYILPKNNILRNEEGVVMKPPVEIWLSVKNESKKRLGIPLPEGTIKVFKRNEDNSLFYVGENKTAATPLGKSLSFRLGTTKDIVAEMQQTDYRKLGHQVVESGYRLDLKNNTNHPKQVTVFQNVTGEWVVLRETHPHEADETRLWWLIPLAPKESVSLRYRIRMNVHAGP